MYDVQTWLRFFFSFLHENCYRYVNTVDFNWSFISPVTNRIRSHTFTKSHAIHVISLIQYKSPNDNIGVIIVSFGKHAFTNITFPLAQKTRVRCNLSKRKHPAEIADKWQDGAPRKFHRQHDIDGGEGEGVSPMFCLVRPF